MRRTLFVVTLDDAPTVRGAVTGDIAAKERRRLERWLADAHPARGPEWLARVERRTRETLADGTERRTEELARRIPELGTELMVGSGKWARAAALGSRLLSVMAMEGQIVRASAAGTWRSSQYGWAGAVAWFGAPEDPPDPHEARVRLVRRYVGRFGPVTLDDARWWTGLGLRHLRAALDELRPARVVLDDGAEAFVLPGDLDAPRHGPRPAVSFLPALDPTPMGWKGRAWYLGVHRPALFDRNGNVGPTIWVDGGIVGGWAQRRDGSVAHRLLQDVGAEAQRLVADEAARLDAWLDARTTPRFRTPLERALSG